MPNKRRNKDCRESIWFYVELEDLVHEATKVEQKLKRKGVIRRSSSNFNSPSWKDKNKEGNTSSSNSIVVPQRTQIKSYGSPKKIRSSEIKCFKCLGKGHNF